MKAKTFAKDNFVGCDGEPRALLDTHSATCSLRSYRSTSRYRMQIEYTVHYYILVCLVRVHAHLNIFHYIGIIIN